jgi:hypothetical protein
MNEGHEDFIHFDTCIDRLQSAFSTLHLVKRHEDHPLAGSAFRFALVEYAIPYTRSDGPLKKWHHLDTQFIPKQYMELHQRLMNSRNQIQAHADLTPLEARLSYVDLPDQRLVTTIQNNVHGLEERENIEEVIALISATLGNMSRERDRRKLAL